MDDVITKLENLCQLLNSVFEHKNKTICSSCKNWCYSEEDVHSYEVLRGCCAECSRHNGFMDTRLPRFDAIKTIYWYNDTYGFFNPELLTCNLPRGLRSEVCLRYYCDKMELSEKDIKLVKELSFEIHRIVCNNFDNVFRHYTR